MAASIQTDFGERVRKLRTDAGRSQEEFAAQANIDRSTYGKLERGLINASLLTMARVAVALDISLAELLDGLQLDADEVRSLPRSATGPKRLSR
ncbi:helix-turn-helix transcriptional regulator [Sphingomonas sp.]|uniref:helix-turn-helix domain-containing protein n=1 Tax=Sphingomonas sp. TaxID=28214 RepID=UPI002E3137B0|nr:helix-turn-helix transcriptional regulator [Sphingomonas sp.]